jgi:hypothetical protein
MRSLLPAFLCLVACSNGQPSASPQADSTALAQSAAPPADTTLIPGTPPGDLDDWVADMRAGLDTVASELKTDRAAVQKRVIDIYVTRQEFAEQYYGPGGRMGPTPELAASIKTAEDRFHELMLLTNASPPATEPAIRAAIDKVQQQLGRVAELSKGSQRRVRSVDTTEAAR